MDSETREFLSQPRTLKCPKCNFQIAVTVKQLGKIVICPKCGLKISISKEINYENGTEDLLSDIKEYLNEK